MVFYILYVLFMFGIYYENYLWVCWFVLILTVRVMKRKLIFYVEYMSILEKIILN